MNALYERDGDAFVGTEVTAGAWNAGAQSGGAVLALLGHVLEDVPTLTAMSLTRLTVDLVRPVPVGERLWIEHDIVREGKKIQVVDFRLVTEGNEHARARALRIRDGDLGAVAGAPSSTTDVDPATALPSPEALEAAAAYPGLPPFLRTALDFRRTDPWAEGINGIWLRLRVPVVVGEPVRATSRATVPMDVVNLIGAKIGGAEFTAINPDVSAHVARPPIGEWIGLVGETIFAHGVGHGVSAATMSDADGVFGVTSTSQILDHIPVS